MKQAYLKLVSCHDWIHQARAQGWCRYQSINYHQLPLRPQIQPQPLLRKVEVLQMVLLETHIDDRRICEIRSS